jgi:hypothetical protein
MRSALHVYGRKGRARPTARRCNRWRGLDRPELDDEEEIVEIGGGPADDKAATG